MLSNYLDDPRYFNRNTRTLRPGDPVAIIQVEIKSIGRQVGMNGFQYLFCQLFIIHFGDKI